MTQQYGLGRALGVAHGLQGLRAQQQAFDINQMNMQNTQADRAAAEQSAAAQAEQQAMLSQLKQRASQGDKEAMRQLVAADPEIAGNLRRQLDLMDESRINMSLNNAAGLKRLIEQNPDQAVQYWQQNLANDPAFAGLADNFQAGDYEGAIREIGMGVTLAGGEEAYQSLFGQAQQDPTAFMQEMIAAGIEPGSQAYKDAVLERYGKGQTIGFDVVEAVNPETGRNEYYQVSRVDPGRQIPLGIEVPVDQRLKAAQSEANAAAQQERAQELETMDGMLQNIGQILDSPGLESWSGLQGFVPIVPGTEQANTDAYIERLKSQQFLENIGSMEGMGALSNAEGAKVSAAAASINRFMTDKAIKAELERIQSELKKGRDRIESGNLLTPSQSSDASQPRSGRAEGLNSADRAANSSANNGAMTSQEADAFIDSILMGGQ